MHSAILCSGFHSLIRPLAYLYQYHPRLRSFVAPRPRKAMAQSTASIGDYSISIRTRAVILLLAQSTSRSLSALTLCTFALHSTFSSGVYFIIWAFFLRFISDKIKQAVALYFELGLSFSLILDNAAIRVCLACELAHFGDLRHPFELRYCSGAPLSSKFTNDTFDGC